MHVLFSDFLSSMFALVTEYRNIMSIFPKMKTKFENLDPKQDWQKSSFTQIIAGIVANGLIWLFKKQANKTLIARLNVFFSNVLTKPTKYVKNYIKENKRKLILNPECNGRDSGPIIAFHARYGMQKK